MVDSDDLTGVLTIIAAGILLILVVFLIFSANIPAGNVGIIDEFGNVREYYFNPGLQFKAPWVGVTMMSIKTQEFAENATTPTKEGLSVDLDVSILYHIEANRAIEIYKTIGTNYPDVVMVPNLRSAIRQISATYDAKALYTSEREVLAENIFTQLEPVLKERGIILEKVLLRSIYLPEKVKAGIEAKLVAEQSAQQMEFVIQKESKEADRKVIEAEGIAKAQAIIDKSLTNQYLEWYWVSNLDKYKSIIYVPIGNNGMPIFKDVDKLDMGNSTN